MKELLGKWTRNRKLELPGQVSLYKLSSVSLKNNQHKKWKTAFSTNIYFYDQVLNREKFIFFRDNMIKRQLLFKSEGKGEADIYTNIKIQSLHNI